MTRYLTGTRACLTPVAAEMMYARQAEWDAQTRIDWSDLYQDVVIFEYRRLKFGNREEGYAGWKFLTDPSDKWDCAKRIEVSEDRWAYEGRCADFASELFRRLQGRRVPRGCMGRVTCRTATGVPHMVLAVDTSEGTLICCNIQDCWPADDPAFRGYEWLAREGRDGAWESLETVEAGTLEDLLEQ